jgi:hypothetical protein
VILETDCAGVLDALSRKDDRSEFRFIVAEAKEHAQLLEEWCVAQVIRECNLPL